MDKRKNNGGHSTKSKGLDKRRNQFKDVLKDTMQESELASVFQMLYDKAVLEHDVAAAKLIIEYAVGKPSQQLDVTSEHRISQDFSNLISFTEADDE
tara:strand:- start:304 stop:594 length:291 start_codon:yes stop_codon:yes gene_type:complete